MYWLYMHLPKELGEVKYKGGELLKVVNAEDCPKYKDKPCKKDDSCCLGCDPSCTKNACHNLRALSTITEGQS